MRILLAALPLVLLAACGRGGDAGADGAVPAANEAAPANAAAPGANAAKPADSASPFNELERAEIGGRLDALRRAEMVLECVADVAGELAPGADANALCECAVDRMQGESGERDALEACAAQLGIAGRRP